MGNSKRWLGASLALMMAVGASAADRTLLEGIVIRVNDRIVTVSDYNERLAQELSQRPEPPTGDELRKFAQQLLDAMVDEIVLLELGEERQITVDETDIDRAVQALREENALLDDAAFHAALAEAGIDEQMLRARYRDTILLQRVMQSEVRPVELTWEEVRRVYEADRERFRTPAKVELAQMFFPVAEDGADRDQVRQLAESLVERVRGGSDLKAEATLAGVQLQELGAIPIADLRPDLRATVEELAAGELSDPVATAGGLQVVVLEQRIPEGYVPFEEARERLRLRLSQERFQQESEGVVDRLRERYLVKVSPELVPLLASEPSNG